MTDQQKYLKEHFLEPETRCETDISVKTKKIWKAELDLLEEFIRICKKHNLKWFMIGGALIGTVRHKGFIPWDDDIDVTMPRPDFNKFVKIAANELKAPYALSTSLIEPQRWYTMVARICNSNTAAIYGNYPNDKLLYNYGIFLDISALDGVSRWQWVQKFQQWFVYHVKMLGYFRYHKEINGERKFWRIRKFIARILYAVPGPVVLNKLRTWGCSLVGYGKTEKCGVQVISFMKRDQWPYSAFQKTLVLPYEYLDVNVPAGYDEILTIRYGNWHYFARQEVYHSIDFYPDTPYPIVLKEKYGFAYSDFEK